MIDPALLKAYQLGIVIGVVVLSTLIVFPGRTESPEDDGTTSAVGVGISSSQQLDSASGVDRSASSVEKANALQNSVVASTWTPHRRLNAAVYVILIGAIAVSTVISYSDSRSKPTSLLQILWRTYFPKEAAVLHGLPKRQDGGV
jgi:hypothetical protein